ncbi:deoxyguanosinetriphosphate triphosphohydrolase [Parasphingorhabdus cellanae]|uniref:Deoxyguanosinetriphosphate triphosphohydrolase-like protein n=1 Tax=Parasphingorhabdus cellanae TaxID=2806553 RepID=A0ABX7T6J4_9SPHN|nr:deoxyguanosinetriphosphate triphosphohydrolase [Parasphingorhabdus cellanae]QTD55573.1 deoxyguanosinetriphosphate triphosphohydrolase [Parasphingorhabdus cellanae]
MTGMARYASDPRQSRGRLHDEERSEHDGSIRGPRDDFQRDRDRIIHSISFRRLRHKTQVFVSPDGDHFRVRLTHSLEVAQIGRTIARSLGLNEDLTEALCLAHDIGHPPFGHAGEDALEEALADHGGFDHNAQTIRTLTKLERPYPRWDGLNLTWEMLEGLAKHNGPVSQPTWAMVEANALMDLDLGSWPSLEAQIAAVADDIAYDNHDIDDGIRAGLLSIDQLLILPFIAERWSDICTRFPDVERDRLVPELIRDQIGLMVNDVIATTLQRIKDTGIALADDVRGAGLMIGGFSDDMATKERALKKFMYANLYNHPEQMAAADNARVVVADLVNAYRNEPSLMPDSWTDTLPSQEPDRIRHIADFMAGMTDRYASKRHAEIFG